VRNVRNIAKESDHSVYNLFFSENLPHISTFVAATVMDIERVLQRN